MNPKATMMVSSGFRAVIPWLVQPAGKWLLKDNLCLISCTGGQAPFIKRTCYMLMPSHRAFVSPIVIAIKVVVKSEGCFNLMYSMPY